MSTPSQSDIDFGKRLKRIRREKEMTQDELAEKSGFVSRTSISKIEAGVHQTTQSQIKKLANALNVRPAVLMGWVDNDEEEKLSDLQKAYLSLGDEKKQMLLAFAEFLKEYK